MKLAHIPFVVLFCCFLSCEKDKQPEAPPQILAFSFPGTNVISVQIDHELKIVKVMLPYRSEVKGLTPLVQFSSDSEIIPASGMEQDFSRPVYYTLISDRGVKVIYTVRIETEEQPSPSIVAFEKDSVEAGKEFTVLGKHFGSIQPEVDCFLIDRSGFAQKVTSKLVDSSHLNLSIPLEVLPGEYFMKIKVRNKEIQSDRKMIVTYPSPQLISLSAANLLAGDTLWVSGKFLDSEKYTFQLQLSNESEELQLALAEEKQGQLGFLVPGTTDAGVYEVKVFNQTENRSGKNTLSVHVYDHRKPFVTGVLNPESTYKAGDVVDFSIVNFESYPIRFYQVELYSASGSYIQNGLCGETLQITLPANIKKGNYNLRFYLSNPARNYGYKFLIDKVLTVN